MANRPRIFTIHPSAPFLATLVDALLDGRLVPDFAPRQDPLALVDATIFLPTRRSIRAVRETFLASLGGAATFLPRLLALGEVDDDEILFDGLPDLVPLPESVGVLDRQIALTSLVLAWARRVKSALIPLPGRSDPLLIPASPGDAARLASTLAAFMDGLETERIGLDRLESLRSLHAGRHDRYFEITLEFLTIVTRQWPQQLQDWGLMDPIARRNRLIERETARFSAEHRSGPVIIAGSTGSIPATRDLIAAVARRQNGAVVLPGLDQELDELGWRAIEVVDGEGSPTHPQAGLFALLQSMAVDRSSVVELSPPQGDLAARSRLVTQALRPASTTDQWRANKSTDHSGVSAAFEDVSIVEAATEAEEALAIATILREGLEEPGHRIALVTPDRGLAARVVAELARWKIIADDSAGHPLLATAPGIYARLVLDAAMSNFAAVPLLAMLKSPLCALGIPRASLEKGTTTLEIAVLRGPALPPGLAALSQALTRSEKNVDRHAPRARMALGTDDFDDARTVLQALQRALQPFADLFLRYDEISAATLFAAHTAAILASSDNAAVASGEAGEALVAFLADLARVKPQTLVLPSSAYPGLFNALAAGRTIRGGDPAHPRLARAGLLEARLIPVDRLVLAGLDEGVWPPSVSTDPWLNRPMRSSLGLTAPERRIGLAAHDFTQSLGTRDVFITRAIKRKGSPTVPARWLQRLHAYIGHEAYQTIVTRGAFYLDAAKQLDAPEMPVPTPKAPTPCPPLHLRPTNLSVTAIEHLQRDPYTIYARSILRLDPLDPIAVPSGAADRGTLIHAIAERFARKWNEAAPRDPEALVDVIINDVFAPFMAYPDVRAFWLPRAKQIGQFLVRWEAARRQELSSVAVEAQGSLSWTTIAGRSFTLHGKADRIEISDDGSARIVDFKTSEPPTKSQVEAGFAPQLPLEVAMLLEGAFRGIARPLAVSPSLYVHLSGRREGGVEKPVILQRLPTEDHASETLSRLKELVDRFEDEKMPYRSLLHPLFKGRRYGDYDHLARVREWSLGGDEGDAEA